MQRTLVDTILTTGLGSDFITPAHRETALLRACVEYSALYPVLKRTGEMHLAFSAAIAKTEIFVIGGTLADGASIRIDDGGRNEEVVTVTTVEDYDFFSVGVPVLKLTLSSGLTKNQRSGISVTELDASGNAVYRVPLRAGRETHLLPSDFIRVEEDSFGIVTGEQTSRLRVAFYDNVYQYSSYLSGTRGGSAQQFGGNTGIGGAGGILSPTVYLEGSINPSAAFQGVTIQDNGDAPRLLTPTPPTSDTEMRFKYYGVHIPETIPARDTEALLALTTAHLLEQQASLVAQMPNYSQSGISENPSAVAATLQKQAEASRQRFNILVKDRPYIVSG